MTSFQQMADLFESASNIEIQIEAHKDSLRRLTIASRQWDRETAQRGLNTIDNITRQLEALERSRK
ncbi:hypothetical protein [Metapseudomonas otitidis]|uniref:hypothetical protein n=1 Tax=Metapseudomonas otitidis TaxID=319939 RepID=UPI003670C0B3